MYVAPKGVVFPKGLTDEKAGRMLDAFRAGKTMRGFSVGAARFRAYCDNHPEWAAEALPLLEANRKASDERKAEFFRSKTHCKRGHTLADAHVYINKGYRNRACIHCRALRGKQLLTMSPETTEKVKLALLNGATVGQIIQGKPPGGGKRDPTLRIVDPQRLAGSRRLDPELDRFIIEATANNGARGQQLRYAKARARIQSATRREEANDYHKISAMLPAGFPDKDDVVSRIFESLLDGSLRREDVRSRVKFYIAEHNRLFPTKFAKFGDNPLLSLDELAFEDGSTTRGDNVSRSLWD
ncbi:hypothetical protein [Bradyrhizobium elkanii]|uniref:hypothetical protein n=1 Tax=Bradyrhizobium elkanii TaxID=29448 RepID=UPI0027152417|nr:hypothetical protein [Bradyrhizobium elkanii]WLA50762.1 hypothetical protein QIH80_11605 [Bradyrhizobium elkanii]WLB79000.1 hypothetical protein QIH83_32410 [Bradyrhizobium elkanii]